MFFMIQKPIFMLCQHRMMTDVNWYDWLSVIWHGLPLDFSIAGYLTIIPAILIVVSVWIFHPLIRHFINGYSFIIILAVWLVIIADNGTFPYWGFRIDKTIFIYLTSPKEVLASANWWIWFFGVIVYILSVLLTWVIYKKTIGTIKFDDYNYLREKFISCFVLLLLCATLFLPIRGSLSVSTMNTGRVYFSENRILNLAAINPVFNLFESLSEQTFDSSRYCYMSSNEAQQIIHQMIGENTDYSADTLFTTSRPNIILIIWESMSANALFAMPATQKLAESGIWFSNVYASSFRTDRGVVAILSGFPGQPTSSLMTAPSKTKSLHYISRDLQDAGYLLHWYYGGDEDFTNMRSYLLYGGFTDRVSDKSFPVGERLSKWGVQDNILFNYCSNIIGRRELDENNHFDAILTLSSHEPFDVPVTNHFDDLYLNSLAFTDSCIGAFVDSLRMSPRWDKTLIVITGDHGYPYPYGIQNHDPQRYAIPLILCGGAVRHNMKIEKICSQIDWIPIVLNGIGLDADKYSFSKNILSDNTPDWAFYSYNDGWGLITDHDTVIYDRIAEKSVYNTDSSNNLEYNSKAFVQRIYEKIDSLSIK